MSDSLTYLIVSAAGLVNLICFLVVLVKMFQHGETGMGVLCIVLCFCCGIGVIVTFIYGWVRSREWNIQNLMIAWTVGVAIDMAAGAVNPAPFRELQKQWPGRG